MSAPARHQLGLLLLCDDPIPLVARLLADGFLRAGDIPGTWRPGPVDLVGGGFLQARVVPFDSEQFISSGQGGFRVWCPDGGPNITAAFARALTNWRAGGARSMACGCGAVHDLPDLDYRPSCGFSRGWVELVDVGSSDLTAAGHAALPLHTPILARRG